MLIGSGILLAALFIRVIVTIILDYGSAMNYKEKLFCAVAMSTKATVQAALAPVLIGLVLDTKSDEYVYAEKVMMICILSIVLTAPPMAIFVEVFGPKLLKNDTNEVVKRDDLGNSVEIRDVYRPGQTDVS
ncbi:sodium/hydrogen exchanger 9B1-like [Sitophilus oryzae]|uniref:Sodium/hydrogen exchanger 9B1-like n=1 Tax=Sitophilus oryzae TaxID=7048 RepID=A0A6J2YY14_SITOR|nr:sodium/hydrogen exchanger 9B1-like [Sitophilus oryzae]